MLAMLIFGPNSVTSDHFDEFMGPLVDELLDLWTHGIYIMDAASYNGSSNFIMRAMVIWTIGDFPAYGMMASCTTKGFHGCHVCGGGYRFRRAKLLHKNVYCNCARRCLPENHHMRLDSDNFGTIENCFAPPPVSRETALRLGLEMESWLRDYGTPQQDDPVRKSGIKRNPCFYCLPYWKVRFYAPLRFMKD